MCLPHPKESPRRCGAQAVRSWVQDAFRAVAAKGDPDPPLLQKPAGRSAWLERSLACKLRLALGGGGAVLTVGASSREPAASRSCFEEWSNRARDQDRPCPDRNQTEARPAPEKSMSPKILRRYQRSLSKHRMKDNRYKLSGKIHKNGTTATSWHS